MLRVLAIGCRKWQYTAQLIFAHLAILAVCFSAEQTSNSFQFGLFDPNDVSVPFFDNYNYDNLGSVMNLSSYNMTCLDDFRSTYGYNLTWTSDDYLYLNSQQCRNVSNYSGRCLYTNPVNLLKPVSSKAAVTSFSTFFRAEITQQFQSYPVVNLANGSNALQRLTFFITNDTSTSGEGGGYLGWLSSANNGQPGHNFAVELDFFSDAEFSDPVETHVGVNVNSMTSQTTHELVLDPVNEGYEGFSTYARSDENVSLIGFTACVWIEYDSSTQVLNVIVATDAIFDVCSLKPLPLISIPVNLTDVFQEESFTGFSGSLSNVSSTPNDSPPYVTPGYTISHWTFASDGPALDYRRTSDGLRSYRGPSINQPKNDQMATKILAAKIAIPSVIVLLSLVVVIVLLLRRNSRLKALAKKYQLEELEHLGRGAQSFKYQTLSTATKGFSSKLLLGAGGFGSVYKGTLRLQGSHSLTDVAVKRISSTSEQGAREFLAEVKIIGQVQHRNLVRLVGWCHEKGELLLVYDFMPNGSLDQHLYESEPNAEGPGVLTWARRLKIVSGVAMALAYLHEEWEQRVIHRDVKSSNVMLDIDFNARLGDFGLARLSAHGQAPPSTLILAGTRGYLAPELGHTLKATEKTDVYSFGALVLEIATGNKPILSREQQTSCGMILLVDWVWSLYGDGRILEAADDRLLNACDSGEMVTLLKVGLLCCHPNPDERPSMREVLNIWTGRTEFPPLPGTKPVPIFGLTAVTISDDSDAESASIISGNVKDSSCSSSGGSQLNHAGKVFKRPTSLDFRVSFSDSNLRSRTWRSTPLPT